MRDVQIYSFCAGQRSHSISLAPLLSFNPINLIEAEKMKSSDLGNCKWLGYSYQKGVTSVTKNISIVALPGHMGPGLHADLVNGLDETDSGLACYADDHKKGFGSFTRWVYFSDPTNQRDFLGIDWSIVARPSSGVANSYLRAAQVIKTLFRHGLNPKVEVVLLNGRMMEDALVIAVRSKLGLVVVADWVQKFQKLFGKGSNFCPRCGLQTLTFEAVYCYACGCNPDLIWQ